MVLWQFVMVPLPLLLVISIGIDKASSSYPDGGRLEARSDEAGDRLVLLGRRGGGAAWAPVGQPANKGSNALCAIPAAPRRHQTPQKQGKRHKRHDQCHEDNSHRH